MIKGNTFSRYATGFGLEFKCETPKKKTFNIETQQCTCKENFCNSHTRNDEESEYASNVAQSLVSVTFLNANTFIIVYCIAIILPIYSI